MMRAYFFNYIEGKLTALTASVRARGKLNILDYHTHLENFYMHFVNLLFTWELKNLNTQRHNVEGIDLIDSANELVVQVSATSTKQKIDDALSKEILSEYPCYRFKFIAITNDASDLRKKEFANPYNVEFSPKDDILDTIMILKKISVLDIEKLEEIFEFIKKELGCEIDIVKLDSNIAVMINILSREDLVNVKNNKPNTIDFDIDKKIQYNNLNVTRATIEDYKVYQYKVEETYKVFDKQGINKSYAVLQIIRKQYHKACIEYKDAEEDMIFLKTIENVKDFIVSSKNYIEIPVEELDVCVNIIVVDAFFRCKIFRNPEGYNYVATR